MPPLPSRRTRRFNSRAEAKTARGRSIGKLGKDLRKVTLAEVRRITLAVYRQSVKESPVGKPKLWKSKRRPPGYVGGAFKKSWFSTILPQKLMGVVGNTRAYARRLMVEGHSKQVPRPWWKPMVARVLKQVAEKPMSWKRAILESRGAMGGTFSKRGGR